MESRVYSRSSRSRSTAGAGSRNWSCSSGILRLARCPAESKYDSSSHKWHSKQNGTSGTRTGPAGFAKVHDTSAGRACDEQCGLGKAARLTRCAAAAASVQVARPRIMASWTCRILVSMLVRVRMSTSSSPPFGALYMVPLWRPTHTDSWFWPSGEMSCSAFSLARPSPVQRLTWYRSARHNCYDYSREWCLHSKSDELATGVDSGKNGRTPLRATLNKHPTGNCNGLMC